MKKIIGILIAIAFILIILIICAPSYSYGYTAEITGQKGSRVLKYYDVETNTELNFEEVINYYDLTRYYKTMSQADEIYFYNGREITKDEYEKGYYDEIATKRKNDLGNIAFRLKNTSEVIKKIDYLFDNSYVGKYYIEYSPYDNINWDEVNSYLKNKYGVENYKQNYYKYSLKGRIEPYRFINVIQKTSNDYEYEVNTEFLRITKNDEEVAVKFVNNLLPFLNNYKTDYEKILAAYTYITQTTKYLVDDGLIYGTINTKTSIYATFIDRAAACIGQSIGFAYLMDRLGIESYIVDRVEIADNEKKEFYSTHTYNIVKLEGKWYVADTTGGIFLGVINTSQLYKPLDNMATSSYNRTGKPTVSLDYTKINKYLNEAKNTKTTTTTYVKTTTKRPTYTTKKITTTLEKTKNTTNNQNTSLETTTSSKETKTLTYNYEEENNNENPKIDSNDNKPLFVNILLGFIGVLGIIVLIFYELKRRKS